MKKKLFAFLTLCGALFLASCGNDFSGSKMAPAAERDQAPALYDMETEAEEMAPTEPIDNFNTESYDYIRENDFLSATQKPLSTFSIDVDYASYSNTRRFLNQGQFPPKDAVRIEEFVNYFSYDYPQPQDEHPFSVTTELAECPWNKDHQLIQIGLKGKEIEQQNLPNSNLVFLLDVSGSMEAPNKLPLLRNAFKLLVNQMRAQDRVAIVVYAGSSGLVLPSTSGNEKQQIIDALDQLQAGGSTAGAEGLELAYKVAGENFIKNGNNRIILATDGDFNVGPSSDAQMQRMIEEKRDAGIFLSVLGFGMGNYKDSKMEKIADNGNGNYAYIDNIQEARKVLVTEMASTLFTIAKDVKIQVEFNPAKVQEYRLIGYENRLMRDEDFNDDKKDAGEIGAGHTVTALYELVPVGAPSMAGNVDDLKYQKPSKTVKNGADEWMTVKLRYKQPKEDESTLLEIPIKGEVAGLDQMSENLRFASAVAGFGMLLRDSKYKGDCSFDQVVTMAKKAKGEDPNGYRMEFIKMAQLAADLTPPKD
jgi:Ca-activated chloride channel family protein